LGDHFVVGIKRAIEEQELTAGQPLLEVGVNPRAAGDVVKAAAAIADFEPDRVAVLGAKVGASGLVLQIKCDLGQRRTSLRSSTLNMGLASSTANTRWVA
jgi:hypothetical protein